MTVGGRERGEKGRANDERGGGGCCHRQTSTHLKALARDTQGCDHGGESVICDDITPQRHELPLALALRAAAAGRGHQLCSCDAAAAADSLI